MNFYKHFLGDYARDTAHLSMLEHGAYRLMLDHYYATGKSLPADKVLLYRICKASSKTERAAVDLVSDSFFPVNGDGTRHNYRADKEIGQWTAQAEINREIGKLGGRPRKTESVSESVSEPEPNRNPSHSQIPEKTKTRTAMSGKPDLKPLAIEVLNFLNTKAGRAYRQTESNLGFIIARLRDGATAGDCKQVIAKKCREWANDPKMEIYLRPATLFNRTKFDQYTGELVEATNAS